jgi:predicted short-subunit dehydrogenase-like oxidoreductase (DUF2520 family)
LDKVCIIGFGKLGSHLYYALNKTSKYRVHYVLRNSRARLSPQKLSECSVIFICTPDSGIKDAVKELKKKSFVLLNKYIFHTSGAFDSGLLKPLEAKGAFTGSFHPAQTFEERVKSYNKRLNGIYIITEGSREAVRKANEIAHALLSKFVSLGKDEKILHHINSVIASNYLVCFFYQIEKVSHLISGVYARGKGRLNGFKNSTFLNIYKPLIVQTLKNIEKKGTQKSLTGPISRNDLSTVKAHIKIIKKRMPSILEFYSLMGNQAVQIALKNKSINRNEAKTLLRELNKNS